MTILINANIMKILYSQLKWLLSSLPSRTGFTVRSIAQLFDLYTNLQRTRGKRFAVYYIKSIRLIVTRFITRHPISTYPHIKIKKGLPANLPKEIETCLRNRNTEMYRWVLTLLTFTRCFTLPAKPDYDPITMPWSGHFPDSIKKTIIMWESPHTPDNLDWTDAHWTTKSGPSGPAIAEALNDQGNLPVELQEDLFLLGGEFFKKYFLIIREAFPNGDVDRPNTRKSIRRIHLLEDKEGKTRIIAMLDWWSQTVLRKYHDCLIETLRAMPGDFTYQGDVNKHLSSGDGPYFSFDLSSATDRFPVEVQRFVMERLFGRKKSDAWVRVITKWPFDRPDGSPISWETGQPLGAYSSWAAFALTHHMVLMTACKDEPNARYAVLGDDVVIRGHSAAMKYKSLIHDLGVPLSETKTHVSRDTFEFAKRWFHGGEEITPFPLCSILTACTRFVDLAQAFSTAEAHGWPRVFTTPGLIASYLREGIGMKYRHSQNIESKVVKFIRYLDLTQSTLWEICISKSEVLKEFLTPVARDKFSNLSLIEKVHAVRQVFLSISESTSERVLKQLEESMYRFFREGKALVSASTTEFAPPVGLACGSVGKSLRNLLSDFYSKSRLPEMADLSLTTGEEALAIGKLLRAVPLTSVPVGNDGRIRKSVLILRAKAEMILIIIDKFSRWGSCEDLSTNLTVGPEASAAFSARMFKEMMRAINSTTSSDLPQLR